jgi:hypothetical protein
VQKLTGKAIRYFKRDSENQHLMGWKEFEATFLCKAFLCKEKSRCFASIIDGKGSEF